MANLKEIRSRITSVGSTMQITSAMKMVSAAKLKRAQDAIIQMRPYANKLTKLLENLSASLDSSDGGVYSKKREIKNVLLVTVTSNRGLCGGFNAYIIKKAKDLINNEIINNEVCLFMKGTPDAPQCGFSMAISNMLKVLEVDYKGVNVLADQSLREGIKEFSDWPTIPQLYIKNEFTGGCDIVKEMYENGELKKIFKEKNNKEYRSNYG